MSDLLKGYKIMLRTERGLQPLNELKRLWKGSGTNRTFGNHTLLQPAALRGPISVWLSAQDVVTALQQINAMLTVSTLHNQVSVECWDVLWSLWKGNYGKWEHDDDLTFDGKTPFEPPKSVRLAKLVVLVRRIDEPLTWFRQQLTARVPATPDLD